MLLGRLLLNKAKLILESDSQISVINIIVAVVEIILPRDDVKFHFVKASG
jgi:hypothetical protein